MFVVLPRFHRHFVVYIFSFVYPLICKYVLYLNSEEGLKMPKALLSVNYSTLNDYISTYTILQICNAFQYLLPKRHLLNVLFCIFIYQNNQSHK